ncbi:MAG TPA: zf-HC2 domain-containing protein [Myxococcales bacterium]|jgi:anti-sigma factor RsiW|nr:zf-HC2 domain-containing protein [Myxococcales bacterium]
MAHVGSRLQALLSGTLSPGDREEAEAHLRGCPDCREERDLLAAARMVIAPLPAREPRVGFAPTVALNARDQRGAPFLRWLRWSFGGVAAAGAAAVAAALLVPATPASPRGDDVRIAQRLELFEDLAVVQHREALEDLEVVSVLHTLEARP